MDARQSLEEALLAFEAMLARFDAVSTRTDDGRARDLIALRREMEPAVATLGSLGDALFADDRDSLAAYREKLAAVRAARAEHMTNWPAVMMKDANADYVRSADRAKRVAHEFIAAARRLIGRG